MCTRPSGETKLADTRAPRLLLVSYEFPPKGGTQSQWVTKMAAGLADRGWDVRVLTVADPPTDMVDDELLAEVSGRVNITRAWSLEPTRLVQAIRWSRKREAATGDADGKGNRSYTSAPSWLVRLVKALFVPDEKAGWAPWAVTAARDMHRKQPFDLVVTTGPPHSAHAIGRRLKRKLGLPWVANLMDPIVGYYAFRPATPVNASLLRRYERRLVHNADRTTIPTRTMRQGLVRRNPEAAERISVLPNCFDPADFSDCARSHSSRFVISYVGAFQLTITPNVFLKAVAALARDDREFARDVYVRFVGPRDAETDEAIAATQTGDMVERVGFLSHAAAIRAMCDSDVLLLVLGPEHESSAILTSKLTEYMASGRAVLALVPEGEAAELVRHAGAGEVVRPDDVEAVVAALVRLYQQWRAGTLPQPNPEVVGAYDCTRQLSAFDDLLRSVLP